MGKNDRPAKTIWVVRWHHGIEWKPMETYGRWAHKHEHTFDNYWLAFGFARKLNALPINDACMQWDKRIGVE